jgi:hypothetical protein
VASGEEHTRPVVSVYTSERLYDLLCALHVSYDDYEFQGIENGRRLAGGGAKLLLSQPLPPRTSAAMMSRSIGTKSFPITSELSIKTGLLPVLRP